jgi:hypothetical protein
MAIASQGRNMSNERQQTKEEFVVVVTRLNSQIIRGIVLNPKNVASARFLTIEPKEIIAETPITPAISNTSALANPPLKNKKMRKPQQCKKCGKMLYGHLTRHLESHKS